MRRGGPVAASGIRTSASRLAVKRAGECPTVCGRFASGDRSLLKTSSKPMAGMRRCSEKASLMQTSRRYFMTTSVPGAAAAGFLAAGASADRVNAAGSDEAQPSFTLHPIGRVERAGDTVRLRIFDAYVEGLLGLEEWSHVNVFYWFDKNDTPQRRGVLRVHPRGIRENPLTGVFACRAPVRPNLIALSVCKIVSVQENLVTLDSLDAFDATPVLDLKPFIPPDAPTQGVRVPAWARRGRPPGV